MWLLIVAAALGVTPPRAAGAAPLPPQVEISGASRIEYDNAGQRWTFRGAPVVVARGTTRIEAAEVLYAERTRDVTLPAGGLVATPTLEVHADRILANVSNRRVTAEGRVAGRFTDTEGGLTNRAAPPDWGTFTAERVELEDSAALKQIVATGQVVIVRGDRRISGDRVVYNHGTRQGTLDGHAEVARGADRLRAGHVFTDLARGRAEAHDDVRLDHGDLHGSADRATYSEPDQRAVLSGHVKLTRGRDTLTADLATVLLDQDTAIADGHVELVAYPEGGAP